MAKTMEDWFLRGGERPNADNAFNKPDNPHESDACDTCDGRHHCDECPHLCPHLTDGEPSDDEPGKICQNCGVENLAENERCVCCGAALTGGCPTDEYCGADDGDGETLQDWIVTMSRTKTVQQTARVRVKAHSEEEALDLLEDRAEDKAINWPWEDNDDTEEFEDTEAIEAEVAS